MQSNHAPLVRIARQGDILVERIDALPEGLEPASRDALDRIVPRRGDAAEARVWTFDDAAEAAET